MLGYEAVWQSGPPWQPCEVITLTRERLQFYEPLFPPFPPLLMSGTEDGGARVADGLCGHS
jgi:hypothetical protein